MAPSNSQLASIKLADYPDNLVVLGCKACSREFRYLKATLIENYGSELTLESLLEKFTVDCPRKASNAGSALCQMRYTELQISPPLL